MSDPIQISLEQFKKMQDTGFKVEDKADKEIPIRLVIYREKRLRVAHWFLIIWAVFTLLTGNWASIPLIVLWLIACWDIHHANKGIEELLAGLNQAGVIDTPTKAQTKTLRDNQRGKDGQ